MPNIVVLNAISLGMLPDAVGDYILFVSGKTNAQVASYLRAAPEGFESAVGHADTAALFSQMLGVEVPVNHVSLEFSGNKTYVVGQYHGPRLPEGQTYLPEGASISWYTVHVARGI